MEKKPYSPQFLRKRKSLLLLPVVVVPCVCVVFVALGGGGSPASGPGVSAVRGFNMNLPGAHFAKKERPLNKLGFYDKADADSAKLLDREKQDPYHRGLQRFAPARTDSFGGRYLSNLGVGLAADSGAGQLMRQLDQLKQALHRPASPGSAFSAAGGPSSAMVRPFLAEDTRLSDMARAVGSARPNFLQTRRGADSVEGDLQLDKLNGMLDKIIRIQHPLARVSVDSAEVAWPRPGALPVQKAQETAPVVSLQQADTMEATGEGFYSLDEPSAADTAGANTIAAVIPEDQTLVAGSTVSLRLLQDAVIGAVTVPRDNLLYGKAAVSGDRLLVNVSSIRYGPGIYPVSLQVYDQDGLPGIRVPTAITREVLKSSADEGVSGLGLTTLDPSLGAQAASAGIQTAKTLISRKVRLVQVVVKAGYQVLLKNR